MTTNFNAKVVLEDDAISLRPMEPSDWEATFAAASDPLIWALHPAQDRWQESVFRSYFNEAIAGDAALVVIDKASGKIIGSSRYGFDRAVGNEVEIGWTFLSRDHWGGDTNRRMKRLMLRHALAHYDRAIFLVGENNLRSRRAMEKIGGQLTERLFRSELNGATVTHLIYAIDREGFEGGPLNRAVNSSSP
jgi:N-acetyltransferase